MSNGKIEKDNELINKILREIIFPELTQLLKYISNKVSTRIKEKIEQLLKDSKLRRLKYDEIQNKYLYHSSSMTLKSIEEYLLICERVKENVNEKSLTKMKSYNIFKKFGTERMRMEFFDWLHLQLNLIRHREERILEEADRMRKNPTYKTEFFIDRKDICDRILRLDDNEFQDLYRIANAKVHNSTTEIVFKDFKRLIDTLK
ncbi:MAG: hypothetical protein ACQEWW_23075 [Bacillota bacterium]